MISFTRDQLLSIRQNIPHNLFLDFDYSDVLLDNVVCGAVVLFRRFRARRRGKRAGALVKLRELPKYRQHVTCPTRDSNILDPCYTAIKDGYHSVPRAALGPSDQCSVNLILTSVGSNTLQKVIH